jgi:hypothetical protein
MRRIARGLARLTSFRIGLATGLAFALLHLWECEAGARVLARAIPAGRVFRMEHK